MKKSIGLVDVLHAALSPLLGQIRVAFVFGSVAMGSEAPRSDVDVLILGEAGFGDVVNALYDTQISLGREINPKVMTVAEWQNRKASGNGFVLDLLNKPKLFLIGVDDEL